MLTYSCFSIVIQGQLPLMYTLIYITPKMFLIYRIRTKPNLDPRVSLKCNLAWNFQYASNMLSCKIDVIRNKIKDSRSSIICKH